MKKIRMIGSEKEKVVITLDAKNKSSETYRDRSKPILKNGQIINYYKEM